MKKTSLILLIATLSFIALKAPEQSKRTYTIILSEQEANTLFMKLRGEEEKLPYEQYKKLIPEMNNAVLGQLVAQSNNFHVQDSIASVKVKQDSIKNKK